MIIHLPGLGMLGQPRLGSIYDETGTPCSGYEEKGPYHCEDCIHKVAHDSPYCIHPKVVGDPELQHRLVMIDERPTIKIDLEHGCCAYVRQPAKAEDAPKGEDHDDEH
jgi:hypothetical protein